MHMEETETSNFLHNHVFFRINISHVDLHIICCPEGKCVRSPYRWVAVGRDPHTSKVIGIDFVLYKLSPPLFVDVDASRLAMMDLTTHHCGVCVGLHLKARYAVSVDVAVLKVTLKHRKDNKLDGQ